MLIMDIGLGWKICDLMLSIKIKMGNFFILGEYCVQFLETVLIYDRVC